MAMFLGGGRDIIVHESPLGDNVNKILTVSAYFVPENTSLGGLIFNATKASTHFSGLSELFIH